MKKKIGVLLITALLCVFTTSTVFAGFPGIGNIFGGGNSNVAVDVGGLTGTANRIIAKYWAATRCYAIASADMAKACGLGGEYEKTMAAVNACDAGQSLDKIKAVTDVANDATKKIKNQIQNSQISQEEAQELVNTAGLANGAAVILNISILPDAVKLVKETGDGLSGLANDPIANIDGITKLKSVIVVAKFMSDNIPAQQKFQESLNNSTKALANQKAVSMPSQEAVNEKASEMGKE